METNMMPLRELEESTLSVATLNPYPGSASAEQAAASVLGGAQGQESSGC